MIFNNRNKKGVTLIELILALALISTILIISYNLFFSGFLSFDKQINNVDNQAKAKQIVREVSTSIRKDKLGVIIIENGGKTVTANGVTYDFNPEPLNTILKNGTDYMKGIKSFEVIEGKNNKNELKITVETIPNKGKTVTITSTINIRSRFE